jgi:DNA-binding NarL/FixJ family response regulator
MRKLSPREQEVLVLYVEKGRLKPVAETLGRSVHTIRHQRASFMRKLGARNSVELTWLAIQKGLVKS